MWKIQLIQQKGSGRVNQANSDLAAGLVDWFDLAGVELALQVAASALGNLEHRTVGITRPDKAVVDEISKRAVDRVFGWLVAGQQLNIRVDIAFREPQVSSGFLIQDLKDRIGGFIHPLGSHSH